MECIFIGDECFFYIIKDHNIEKDTVVLDLYKNKDDLNNKKILRTVDIDDWSNQV